MDIFLKVVFAVVGLIMFFYGAYSYNRIHNKNSAKLSHSKNVKSIASAYLLGFGGAMVLIALTLLFKG